MSQVEENHSAEQVSAGSAGQTVTSETRAETTPIYVYQTEVPQVQTHSTTTTNASNTSSSGLTPGWIVAIVSLILLAMSLTFIFLKWWLDRRRKRGHDYGRERFRPQSEYYEVTKPPRARQRASVFSHHGRH
jgi:hypothetical protein